MPASYFLYFLCTMWSSVKEKSASDNGFANYSTYTKNCNYHRL